MIDNILVNKWPESQICIGCKHAIFFSEGYGSSAYKCEKRCLVLSMCCDENRIECTDKEWEAKF